MNSEVIALSAIVVIIFALAGLALVFGKQHASDDVQREMRKQAAWMHFYGGYPLTSEQWETINPPGTNRITEGFLTQMGRPDLIPMLEQNRESEGEQ